MKRKRYQSGTPWEPLVGYSRAVRVGNQIWVTGTTATDPVGGIVGVGDMYLQAKQCILNIERAISELGGSLGDVVRTRIYVTDIQRWEEVARAHRESFERIMPATTMIEISKLIDPRMLVEIEADCLVASAAS